MNQPRVCPRSEIVLLAIVFVACCLAAGLHGCAAGPGSNATPLTQVTQARETYTATLNSLANAREAKRISDADWREIETIRAQAATALEIAESGARTGEPINVSLASAQALLKKLIEHQTKAEARK